jgi:hypothetical protein
MVSPIVCCADSKCPLRKKCLRYVTDPNQEIQFRKVTIAASLRSVQFDFCDNFVPVSKLIQKYIKEAA